MRTTLDLDNELYREVKVLAAQRGVTATSLIEEGLREVLARYQAIEESPVPLLPELASLRSTVDINDGAAIRVILEGSDASLP